MRPLNLKIRNFGSYTDQEVDFQNFSIAVLTGESGSGKSTIPDAIAWALYGRSERAKVMSRNADEKRGDMCEAELLFESDGQVYRVVRKRGKNSKKSELSLYTVAADGSETNISDKGIRLVEAQIEKLIGMDYETFRLTAFVPQDGANTFANLPKAERKKFLEMFIDVSVWNARLEAAKSEEKRIVIDKAFAEKKVSDLKKIGEEYSSDDILDAIRANEEKQRALNDEIDEINQVMNETRVQMGEATYKGQNAAEALKNAKKAAEDLEKDLDSKKALLSKLVFELSSVEADSSRPISEIRVDIDRLNDEKAKLGEASHERKNLSMQKDILEDELAKAEKACQSAKAEIENSQEMLNKTEAEIAELQKLSEEGKAAAETKASLTQKAAGIDVEITHFEERLSEISEQIESLETHNGVCPTCGQEMSEEHRLLELEKIKAEKSAKNAAVISMKAETAEYRKEAELLISDIQKGEAAEKKIPSAIQTASSLTSKIDVANQIIAENEPVLQSDRKARTDELAAKIESLSAQLSSLPNVNIRLEELRQEEAEAKSFESKKAEFDKLYQQKMSLDAVITVKEEALAEKKAECAEKEEDLNRLRAEFVEKNFAASLSEMEGEVKSKNNELDALKKEKHLLDETYANVVRAEKEIPLAEAEFDAIAQKLSDNKTLQAAYGDKGIKALLIEQMLPEIEAETNPILMGISDGRYTICLSTAEENDKGGIVETLSIKLDKGEGTALEDYENLSGGEKFKVNFALRIGLSKYIARAANHSLDTLIIDEGFGSQDNQGRIDILKAIASVQREFGLILIITHMDDIKNAFRYEINVTKKNGVSKAEILSH